MSPHLSQLNVAMAHTNYFRRNNLWILKLATYTKIEDHYSRISNTFFFFWLPFFFLDIYIMGRGSPPTCTWQTSVVTGKKKRSCQKCDSRKSGWANGSTATGSGTLTETCPNQTSKKKKKRKCYNSPNLQCISTHFSIHNFGKVAKKKKKKLLHVALGVEVFNLKQASSFFFFLFYNTSNVEINLESF